MERTAFGTAKDGRSVEKLSFTSGRYHFSVLTFGATLCSFGFDDVDVVLSHRSLADYEGDPSYMGEVVGPYANRIAGGSFTLDGVRFQLERNNNGNCLHSGSACFGQKVWDVLGIGESSVTLSISTPDGLGGFPGSHECTVTYLLTSDGTLTIGYTVSSSRKCPVSVTNHSYFNLNGGEGNIKDHILTVPASCYVAVDDQLIPGGVVAVDDTCFDFRTPHRIGERRGGAYDNTFCIDSGAVIKAEGRKARMEIRTTEPGVQIYTAEFLSGDHQPFQGVCFEAGRYPDTPNHPEFPQAFSDAESPYRSTTSFHLEAM